MTQLPHLFPGASHRLMMEAQVRVETAAAHEKGGPGGGGNEQCDHSSSTEDINDAGNLSDGEPGQVVEVNSSPMPLTLVSLGKGRCGSAGRAMAR